MLAGANPRQIPMPTRGRPFLDWKNLGRLMRVRRVKKKNIYSFGVVGE
jgi:hypothetical protein